jgi:hypothetical protein
VRSPRTAVALSVALCAAAAAGHEIEPGASEMAKARRTTDVSAPSISVVGCDVRTVDFFGP